MFANNKYITSAESLVTTHEETRAGFLRIALEKNRAGDGYVKSALAFKAMAVQTNRAEELLEIPQIRPFLIAASGLSEKSLAHLNEADRTAVIRELIENFLKPAGDNYIDEAMARYLLVKGDAVGGVMRNKIGALGQERLIRAIYAGMKAAGIGCNKLSADMPVWSPINFNDAGDGSDVKALQWTNAHGGRLLIFNATIPTVEKNVDICLYSSNLDDFNLKTLVCHDERALMFGELKGGIDPAGADEHWKTGNTALNRIRTKFAAAGYPRVMTSFVGAAIERAMAKEIYAQLQSGLLTNAANLTNDAQLAEYSNWLIGL